MKLTRRQKYLACAVCPTSNGACTTKEVRRWRKALGGKIVEEKEFLMFTAFRKNGRLKRFEYCHRPAKAKKCMCNLPTDFYNYGATKLAAKEWAQS